MAALREARQMREADAEVMAIQRENFLAAEAERDRLREAARKLATVLTEEYGSFALPPDHEDYTHEDYLVQLAQDILEIE